MQSKQPQQVSQPRHVPPSSSSTEFAVCRHTRACEEVDRAGRLLKRPVQPFEQGVRVRAVPSTTLCYACKALYVVLPASEASQALHRRGLFNKKCTRQRFLHSWVWLPNTNPHYALVLAQIVGKRLMPQYEGHIQELFRAAAGHHVLNRKERNVML
jgi:hypothetical protein